LANIEKVTPKRARRARERQLDYMRSIACDWQGCEAEIVAGMIAKSKRVRDLLSAVKPVRQADRALEVGSGGTGIIFYFGTDDGVGVDPLADDLRQLFPWQRRSKVPTIAAGGEDLPFNDAEVDIVLSDNVIDHAADPRQILAEIAAC
jgi:SAM-dependent methyltransferase